MVCIDAINLTSIFLRSRPLIFFSKFYAGDYGSFKSHSGVALTFRRTAKQKQDRITLIMCPFTYWQTFSLLSVGRLHTSF